LNFSQETSDNDLETAITVPAKQDANTNNMIERDQTVREISQHQARIYARLQQASITPEMATVAFPTRRDWPEDLP